MQIHCFDNAWSYRHTTQQSKNISDKYCKSGYQTQLCPIYALVLVVCYFIPQLFCTAELDLTEQILASAAQAARGIFELSSTWTLCDLLLSLSVFFLLLSAWSASVRTFLLLLSQTISQCGTGKMCESSLSALIVNQSQTLHDKHVCWVQQNVQNTTVKNVKSVDQALQSCHDKGKHWFICSLKGINKTNGSLHTVESFFGICQIYVFIPTLRHMNFKCFMLQI